MNTEIILPAADLKAALPDLNKIAPKKSYLPVLQNVKVGRDRNGQVTLQASDLDSFATYNVTDKQPGEPVELLVPLEQLNQAFKCSGSKDDVALVGDGRETKLRYSLAGTPVHQPVTVTPADDWPRVPQIKSESFKLDAAFGPALKQALECCSDDQTRSALRGVCLDVTDEKCHYIVASDRRCLFSANSFTFPLTKSIIIPDSKFLASGDLLDQDPCFLSVESSGKGRNTKTLIRLESARWQFITRDIEGGFPEWKQALPTINAKWTVVKLSPPAISQLLQVIPKLPCEADGNHPVRLRIEKSLWIEGRQQKDADWTTVAVSDVTITGKPLAIVINRNYLIQALKFGFDEFAVEADSRPLVFSKPGRKFVIVPIGQKPAAPAPDAPAATQPEPTPPRPEAAAQPERKTEMTKTTAKPEPPKAAETKPSLVEQVELIKESLKNVIRDLTTLADAAKQAEKDQRTSEKEVEAARATLKKLQQVSL